MRRTTDSPTRPRPQSIARQSARFDAARQLGETPPMEADGLQHTPRDRRAVSMRWFTGTVLTGVAGSVLLGGAIYASLSRQSNAAEPPEYASPARRDATGELVNPSKGDRLVKSVDIVAAKQSYRTPTTVTVGDKEVVRVRAFTRVATNLTLTDTGLGDEVPPFNALKVVADNQNPIEAPPDPGPAQDDAEVSFTTRDLPAITGVPSAILMADEVQAQVIELARTPPPGRAAAPLPAQMLLMRTSHAGSSVAGALPYANPNAGFMTAPFSSIQVRMVPENVSSIPKAGASVGPAKSEERLVIVRRGDAIEDILRAAGATREQIRSIVTAFKLKPGQSAVSDGQRIKILFVDLDGSGRTSTIARLSVYADEVLQTTIALSDAGDYVAVASPDSAKPAQTARSSSDDDDDDDDTGGMRLYNSLYETALKQEVPKGTIDDLVRIFSNDVDFQRPVASGDSFEAFYQEGDDADAHSELLYASINTHNETFRYYRFQTPDDSAVDYYDENGRSTRKFLLRKPINGGTETSPFGSRSHPILGYVRRHTGVDWGGLPIGTPIVAAGTGTVIKAGRESGYGNRIEIQHINGYVTTYNHMSGYARGITEGSKVKQGQVIGYLGMTGLATGPHLHYEVIVNGAFQDPMKVKLARTRELDGRLIALFRREKDRIDGLIGKAPNATQVASRAASN